MSLRSCFRFGFHCFYQFISGIFCGVIGYFFKHFNFLGGCHIKFLLFSFEDFVFLGVICDLAVEISFKFTGFTQFVIELVFFVFDSFFGILHFLFPGLDISIVLRFQFHEFFFSLKLFFLSDGFCLYVGFFYKVFGIFLCILYDEFCLGVKRTFGK